MGGRRVLVSGMGGELGSLVATMLEDEPWVGELVGVDVDPPRRRLRRATFHRIDANAGDRVADVIAALDPHVLLHLGVWEPDARVGTAEAKRLTDRYTSTVLAAVTECPSLENIVVRSGIEIYGRGRGALTRPDESCPTRPTTEYGRMVERIESVADAAGRRVGVPVGALRLAPVMGPHVPSPLGRVLRQPAVPFSPLGDPPFALIHHRDAARAFVVAARERISEPVNVVAPGAITAWQALLRGRRVAVPLVGPGWTVARPISYIAGAPIPDHVVEVFRRGRLADDLRGRELLGIEPEISTVGIIDRLYAWQQVVRVTPNRRDAA